MNFNPLWIDLLSITDLTGWQKKCKHLCAFKCISIDNGGKVI